MKKTSPVEQVTIARLERVVAWWRRKQEATVPPVSEIYRQCANDLDLALRDDRRLP